MTDALHLGKVALSTVTFQYPLSVASAAWDTLRGNPHRPIDPIVDSLQYFTMKDAQLETSKGHLQDIGNAYRASIRIALFVSSLAMAHGLIENRDPLKYLRPSATVERQNTSHDLWP